jgi:hypothetical protein
VLKGNIIFLFYCTYLLLQGDFVGLSVVSWILVVIYTWVWGRGLPGYPDVYTKVSAVCDWIIINTDLLMVSGVIN